MLKLKLWLLNLNDIATADEAFKILMPVSIHSYDYYKLYDGNPEHSMMYSIDYLNRTSVIKLLWKSYHYQSMFRRMKVKSEW